MSQLEWTDAQWAMVNQAVTESFTMANVAGSFLPCHGPHAESAETVPAQMIKKGKKGVISVDDVERYSFVTLRVIVKLTRQQVTDPALSSALTAFRKAANLIARTEDQIVFAGYTPPESEPDDPSGSKATSDEGGGLDQYVKAEDDVQGLVDSDKAPDPNRPGKTGKEWVNIVSAGITTLSNRGFPGPYALVMSPEAFDLVHAPTSSMVMPADRIAPLLAGPLDHAAAGRPRSGLYRSDKVASTRSVLISLAMDAIDLAVATPVKVQFLQVDMDAKYNFRVYERFRLRIKDKDAVETLP